MDFLKDIALPQPIEHFHLLLFMLNLVFVLFLPYFGFLFGTSILSVYFNRRSVRTGSPLESRLAWDLIRLGLFTKSGVAFLAILPSLSLVFLLAQFLQGTPAIAPGLMGFGFLTLVAATVLLYVYRYSMGLDSALRAAGTAPSLQLYRASAESNIARAGRWGVGTLVASSILCLGAISVAVNRESWSDVSTVFELFLTPEFWGRYLHFLTVSLGATGIGMLYFLFGWEGGLVGSDEQYVAFVRPLAIRLSVISLLAQPLLVLGSIAFLPPQALSGWVFGLAGMSLALLFVSGNYLYAYVKEGQQKYTAFAFYALVLAFFLVFTKDQVAISNATKDHASSLAISAERDVESLRAKLGVVAVVQSGEDIFNSRCSACHMFDQKKIGPPYDVVIRKYAGNKDALLRFIMNPVKVDPTYPNMPNQGLKPAEADSIATYLMHKVLGGSAPVSTNPGEKVG
ncbi:MAG TPA: c-type cytochrome [Bacteroidota bacterium]|nr:c-type cytochrome [Bacteroidota bacterium]